jgi:pimeloyl-ACP methyl ester carboxylesterase
MLLAAALSTTVPLRESMSPPVLARATLPAACGHEGDKCREELRLSSGWQLSVYRNYPLAGTPAVTHALVVIHGSGRNPVATYAGMMTAATNAGATKGTLVLAPWFKTTEDQPRGHEAVWTNDGWKSGDGAVKPAGLSGFAVVDQIVATLADKARYPNLNWITVVGHSAGGQFTQRYAAFGLAPSQVRGVSFNFVVANPSSFLYFTPQRPAQGGFGQPPASSCPDYDHYKYGMQGRTGYVATLTPAQAFANYTSRRVTILNGGADTAAGHGLDTRCAAMLEGPNRASRGAEYFRYIHLLAPTAAHDRIVVPGVGHDHYELFESPLAAPVLFGKRLDAATNPATPRPAQPNS